MKKQLRKNNYVPVIPIVSFFFLVIAIGFFIFQFSKVPKEVEAVVGTLDIKQTSGTYWTPGGIWDSSGNVGIGTTAPATSLHIIPSASGGVRVEGVSGSITANYSTFLGGTQYGTMGTAGIAGSGFSTAAIGDMFIKNQANSPVLLGTNATERMRIDASGNVGIGTTSPVYPLDVNGYVKTNTGFIVFSGGATRSLYYVSGSTELVDYTGQGMGFYTSAVAGGGSSIRMTIDNSGNVGIGTGTTAPVQKLEVNGSMRISNGSGGGLVFADGTTLSTFPSAGSSQWTTSGGNIYNNNSGNVGIGTAGPNTKLDVQTALTSTTAFANLILRLASNASGADATINFTDAVANNAYIGMGSGALYFATGGTSERMRITSTGNVGIGTTAPGQKLDVAGTIRQSTCKTAGTLSANTSGDIICTSDENLKNIYGYYQGGLNTLSAINPIRFSYKGEDFVHVGFSAQNVKSVLPEASALQDSGYWSLDTTSVTALTVNAIKEQQLQITSLSNKVDTQQKQIDAQQVQIDDLKKAVEELKK